MKMEVIAFGLRSRKVREVREVQQYGKTWRTSRTWREANRGYVGKARVPRSSLVTTMEGDVHGWLSLLLAGDIRIIPQIFLAVLTKREKRFHRQFHVLMPSVSVAAHATDAAASVANSARLRTARRAVPTGIDSFGVFQCSFQVGLFSVRRSRRGATLPIPLPILHSPFSILHSH